MNCENGYQEFSTCFQEKWLLFTFSFQIHSCLGVILRWKFYEGINLEAKQCLIPVEGCFSLKMASLWSCICKHCKLECSPTAIRFKNYWNTCVLKVLVQAKIGWLLKFVTFRILYSIMIMKYPLCLFAKTKFLNPISVLY